MPKILFVCTGNLYRSPLAAAFFVRKLQENKKQKNWEVGSAGTWTVKGKSVPQEVLIAAEKFGLDLKGHATSMLDTNLLATQDLILVMERGHKEALSVEFPLARNKIYMLSEAVDDQEYDIPDPLKSGQAIDALAADLSELMERGHPKIVDLVERLPSGR
ncbi:MAG: hypothetical protein HOP27_15215 [Anaerolineales bacterium]|nr:hypothetical protein [Anaerolineales bacterium]